MTDRPRARGPEPELRVVWERAGLAAIDKPAGLLSQGGPKDGSSDVVSLARGVFGRASVGVLHRLDRNVSGLVLVALDPKVAARMSEAFAAGSVERRYEAVSKARRDLTLEGEFVDAPLLKDPRTNLVRVAARGEPGAREARTRVALRERLQAPLGWLAIVDCWPITGRSHQLRVHLAHVGLPIVGDPKYGVRARGVDRPLLHARALSFTHPATGEAVQLESSPPWSLAELRELRA